MARIRTGIPQRGHPHALSAARIAQLHRWQLLGAAARKGRHTAARDIHHARRAAQRSRIVAPLARAAAWGVSKTAFPAQSGAPRGWRLPARRPDILGCPRLGWVRK